MIDFRNPPAQWYLATEYTKHEDGQHQAYVDSVQAATMLTFAGIPVFCPIMHSHHYVSGDFNFPEVKELVKKPHQFWIDLDKYFMRSSYGMIISATGNYYNSIGIAKEVEFFTQSNKPIFEFDIDGFLDLLEDASYCIDGSALALEEYDSIEDFIYELDDQDSEYFLSLARSR